MTMTSEWNENRFGSNSSFLSSLIATKTTLLSYMFVSPVNHQLFIFIPYTTFKQIFSRLFRFYAIIVMGIKLMRPQKFNHPR